MSPQPASVFVPRLIVLDALEQAVVQLLQLVQHVAVQEEQKQGAEFVA
jgi:hypothetical protein